MLVKKFIPLISQGTRALTIAGRLTDGGFCQNRQYLFKSYPMVTSKRYYPQLPKRFYAEVTVSKDESDGTFEINLDNRKLKTPGKRIFKVKNELLAQAISQEWASQGEYIQQSFMHLTSLANTVQDNPHHKSKFDLINASVMHLPEDTIIYRVPETNSKLLELQNEKWNPMIGWFDSEYKTTIPIVHGSVFPPEIPESAVTNFRSALSDYNFEALQGLIFAMDSLRSVILTMAVAKQKLTVRQAAELGRLETTFQTDHWGNIEWAHDIELQETLSRASAGILFYSFHTLNSTQQF